MTNFTDPNEISKEMVFYTYEEFQKLIACEEDINFEDKTLRVNKNVVSYIEGKKFKVTTPKTKSSNRILPIPDILVNDFRHICTSLLINMVAKYLGHTKIDETLNTYPHLFKNKINDIVNIINNL